MGFQIGDEQLGKLTEALLHEALDSGASGAVSVEHEGETATVYLEVVEPDAELTCFHDYILLDGHLSVLDGSIPALQRRLMIADEEAERARRVLADADLPHGRL